MYKEAVICIITIIGIIVINVFLENYTNNSIGELTAELTQVKEILNEENVGSKNIKEKVIYINEKWKQRYNNFAYYLEHDELEKIAKNIVLLNSSIETKEYSEVIKNLDECVFSLNHIKDKNNFDLKNVF